MAGAMTAGCVLPYIAGIRRGHTKPQRTTWFIFSVLATVAAIAQLAEGASAGAILAIGGAVGFSTVFVLSIRHGVGGFGFGDGGVLVMLVVGATGWWLTDNALVAVVAVIVAEAPAVLLNAHKALHDPGSEVLVTWVIDAGAGAIAAASVGALVFTELLYPVYHCMANVTVSTAIVVGARRAARSGAR